MAIDADLGYDGTEIIQRTIDFVGNKTDEFRDYVAKSLPFAIQRYAKMHDWSFLFKYNLSLSITQGTSEYDLNIANIGFKMSTDGVSKIYSEDLNRQVVKLDITRLRDYHGHYNSGGAAAQGPQFWAEIGDSRILLSPVLFESGTLRVDGKINTTAFETAAAAWNVTTAPNVFDAVYPEIPFKYQEAFIEYVISLALDRENDDRASLKRQEANALVRSDISEDSRRLGDEISMGFVSLKTIYGEDY